MSDDDRTVDHLETAAAILLGIALLGLIIAWSCWFVAAVQEGSQPALRDTGWIVLLGAVLCAAAMALLLAVAWSDEEK